MKKLFVFFLCFSVLLLAGCFSTKKEPAPKPPGQPDTTHLTAESNSLVMTVSRKVRPMSSMNIYGKKNYDVISLSLSIENNSPKGVPVSPDFVTLKLSDGSTCKYSASLTETTTRKAAFKARTVPPDYGSSGLLLFEIKKGTTVESLNYKDNTGHEMTVKFDQNTKTNI